MQKLKLLVFLLLLGSQVVFAQLKTITGNVSDESNEPLPGVTVVVQGTTNGTVTDLDGNYSIKAKDTDLLVFSFIGLESQTIPIAGKTQINAILRSSDKKIEEVVIVGYGVQKKQSVVGAITQTDGDDLKKRGNVSNLTDALSGAMPGVTVLTSTGIPGGGGTSDDDPYAASKILIRGQSTWNDSSPLILVDGVERSMSDIDVNEVQNISVLKDASATAVFGVKGGNGVILITTKRGAQGKPKLNIEANITMKQVSKIPEVLSAYPSLQAANYAILNEVAVSPNSWGFYTPDDQLANYKSGAYPDAYPDNSWTDIMLKKWAISSRVNMNVSGGTEFVKYFGSLSYTHDGDIMNTKDVGQGYNPAYKYDRYNFRTNLDFKLTKTTQFSVNLSGYYGRQQKSGGNNNNLWYGVYSKPATHPVLQYEDGTYGQGIYFERFGSNEFTELNFNGYDVENRAEVNSDFKLTQNLDFITKGLKVSGTLAYDNDFKTNGSNLNDEGIISKYVRPEYYTTPGANIEDFTTWYYPVSYTTSTTGFDYYKSPITYSTETINDKMAEATKRNLYYQFSLNYARAFGKHDVSALALFSREQTNIGSGWPEKREDWVGRVTYNFDTRYFFEANGAYNGSEKFGPGQKFDFFPSIAIGWSLANEKFFKEVAPFVNTLKFRYSNGSVGNDKVTGVGQWPYATIWNATTNHWQFGAPDLVNGSNYYTEGTPGNPNIRWETAHKQNLGLELGLWQNLFSFNIDLFKEHRYDMLVAAAQRTVPDFIGQTPSAANIGVVDSHGLEFEAKFSKSTEKGLHYWASMNWTFAKDKVKYKEDPEGLPFYQKQQGYQIGQTKTMVESGIINSWDEIYTGVVGLSNNNTLLPGDYRLIDYNSDGVIDGDDGIPYGYTNNPQHTYGFALGADYKGVSLVLNFYGVYNTTINYSYAEFSFNAPNTYQESLDNTWLPEYGNDDPTWRALTFLRSASNGSYNSRDGSFLRLKTAELGYTLPKKWLAGLGVSNLRVYANGNNLFFWSNLPVDIEGQNFNVKNYPNTKQINFGVNITF